jgi:hypothetical protein
MFQTVTPQDRSTQFGSDLINFAIRSPARRDEQIQL